MVASTIFAFFAFFGFFVCLLIVPHFFSRKKKKKIPERRRSRFYFFSGLAGSLSLFFTGSLKLVWLATRTTHSTPKLGATSSSMSSIYRSSPAKRSKPGGGAPSSKSVGEGELDPAARSDARWRVEGGSEGGGWPLPRQGVAW